MNEDDSSMFFPDPTIGDHDHTSIRNDSTGLGGSSGQISYVSPPVVARREQRAVARTRLCVLLVLLLAVTAVATTAAMLIKNDEKEDFETQFENAAQEIYAVSREATDSTMEFLSGFSLTLTSHAEDTNTSWPFVAVPHWSSKAKWLADSTGANRIVVAPLVQASQREAWGSFVKTESVEWFQEEIDQGLDVPLDLILAITPTDIVTTFPSEEQPYPTVATGPDPSLPIWQHYPVKPYLGFTNYDLFVVEEQNLNDSIQIAFEMHETVVNFLTIEGHGESQLVQPIFDRVNGDDKMVGIIWISIEWLSYFENILTDTGTAEVVVVMRNTCRQEAITYRVIGPEAVFIADADVHDRAYDDMEIKLPFIAMEHNETRFPNGSSCSPEIWLHMYPTEQMEDSFRSNGAVIYTSIIVLIFAFTTSVLGLYDYFVKLQQEKFMSRVIAQDKIVSNVFPTAAIRDRVYGNNEDSSSNALHGKNKSYPQGGHGDSLADSAPLAELFPSVTVIFADISGFTAWASAREPPQVFQLLESIYGAFDKVASRLDIFKVETVGDCYVAVAGLPKPTADHPVAAAKFARGILQKMVEMTYKMELSLGPGTTDMQLRVGLHSGQVTAGVLRGERARFQLFGDTVNTAARMESTGKSGHIQLSQATAALLKSHGKSSWITTRGDPIDVKGKGKLQTYWLLTGRKSSHKKWEKHSEAPTDQPTSAVRCLPKDDSEERLETEENDLDAAEAGKMSKMDRLVVWNVEVLSSLLQQIVAARGEAPDTLSLDKYEVEVGKDSKTVLDEFRPIIELKRFDPSDLRKRRDATRIDLGLAKKQLTDLVATLAGMYRENSFHNFEHASHVTASVKKLLSRIVSVDNPGLKLSTHLGESGIDFVDLAGHSYGITSDPLTQFAVVLSAIIHDVDHPGVPNVQLVQENTRNAQIYKKSIAEQHSVDIAWDVLMSPEYTDLRKCIYTTPAELKRFRQLIVNTVMATDIADKELQSLRNSRWETAFSGMITKDEATAESEDRKATIVIEHLIQASDVAHTMQHWHVFRRWNERLFMELYSAYQAGRGTIDPSLDWYKGEIGFFDFYVIPLAEKLESCGVFGVSSDEYLGYAKANREEWVRKGELIVKEYLEKYKCMNCESPVAL